MTFRHAHMTLSDVRRAGDRPAADVTTIEVQAGLYLSVIDVEVDRPLEYQSETFSAATLSLVLSGRSEGRAASFDAGVRRNQLMLASDSGGTPTRTLLHPGEPLRAVELVVTPQWFSSNAARIADDASFDRVRRRFERPAELSRHAMDERLRQLALAALKFPTGSASAQLRFEAWSLELLGELVDLERGDGPAVAAARLARADRDRMLAVRELIDRDPATVSSVADLAGTFAISPSKLKRDFFAAFGTCVGAYTNERRLRLAYELLTRKGMRVSEVAYRIGYAHPANFTTAFRRRFGVPPSALKQ